MPPYPTRLSMGGWLAVLRTSRGGHESLLMPLLPARGVGFWPLTAAAVQPAAALKTPVRTPEGEYEEEKPFPSAGGAGGRAHCYRCAGARRFCVENMTPCAFKKL